VERRLLDLGPFARASVSFSPGSPTTIHVEVEEEAPLVARYQLRYNDERGATGELEAEVQNLLGRALALGGRYSRGSGEEEVRGSLHVPSFLGQGDLTLSLARLREELPGVDIFTGEAIENSRIQNELQAQQRLEPWRRWNLLLGYRFKRTTLTPTFPDPVDVAGVRLSLLGDTRDNPLDARRGHFLSLSLEYAPESLGSDFTFAKAFVEAFVSRRLNGALTWAQDYRLGLGWGFGGQQIRSSERFKAGGGHSVRGFATESLGPTDFLGDPAGGEAVLILNQELRYHHPSGLGAALFYDAGNVFPRAEDLSLDLRHAVGVGLRWRSPVGLLRLDLGYPIQPQADERRYRVFFSLGQAF
jgi:outer membrane protein assembly factor BamA